MIHYFFLKLRLEVKNMMKKVYLAFNSLITNVLNNDAYFFYHFVTK